MISTRQEACRKAASWTGSHELIDESRYLPCCI